MNYNASQLASTNSNLIGSFPKSGQLIKVLWLLQEAADGLCNPFWPFINNLDFCIRGFKMFHCYYCYTIIFKKSQSNRGNEVCLKFDLHYTCNFNLFIVSLLCCSICRTLNMHSNEHCKWCSLEDPVMSKDHSSIYLFQPMQ